MCFLPQLLSSALVAQSSQRQNINKRYGCVLITLYLKNETVFCQIFICHKIFFFFIFDRVINWLTEGSDKEGGGSRDQDAEYM